MTSIPSLSSGTQNARTPRVDIRSVIIVAILSFGAGAYSAGTKPEAAGASPVNAAAATAVSQAAVAAPAKVAPAKAVELPGK